MTRIFAALLSVTLIAACGVDGEPIRPTANVNVGVSGAGANVGATLGMRRGPFNVTIGGAL